jgi:hypothetical protein
MPKRPSSRRPSPEARGLSGDGRFKCLPVGRLLLLGADSSYGGEHDRAGPACSEAVARDARRGVAVVAAWLGEQRRNRRAGDRSRGQGVAGAVARRCCHAIPTSRRGPREATASGRVRKRRVGAAQPRIGTSQAWNLASQACGAPVPPRPWWVASGGGDQESGPAFAPSLLSHARIDRPARVICPPPWPVVARARVMPLMVDQPNSIPVPEGA